MTTRNQIAEWFDEGRRSNARYLIVVCDTFDHEDYPIYANSNEEALIKYREHDEKNMQRVMEVYDLFSNRETQLNEKRAFHLPSSAGTPAHETQK